MTKSEVNEYSVKRLYSHDDFVVKRAERLILSRYVRGRHHVACVLVCGDNIYESLHLDNHGFDICAEPTALSNALFAGESRFDEIVSVYWSGVKGERPKIVPPCGNCRQILAQHAPGVRVILASEGNSYRSMTAFDLLPVPYAKPYSPKSEIS